MRSHLLPILLLPILAMAQAPFQFQRTKLSPEISFIQLDSAKGVRSTVIEYPSFLVVIEVPVIDAGGNRTSNLTEDIPKATRYLNYLTAEYRKPVKYVLSTHWHLHSLSGITPFFEHGAQLVVAKSNWQYSLKEGLLSEADANRFRKGVVPVTRDTLLLARSANPIEVWLLDETYRFKPTKEYLFFFLPKSKTLYASCMCAIDHVDFTQKPEFYYSDRVSDLDRAIRERKAQVEQLVKLGSEYDETTQAFRSPVFSRAYYAEFTRRGTPMHTLIRKYQDVGIRQLAEQRDSVVAALTEQRQAPWLINSVVYECLSTGEYDKAIAWGQILNLYHPGDLNYIDTLGEAYFQAGHRSMAEHYSRRLRELDAENFSDALASWQRNKPN